MTKAFNRYLFSSKMQLLPVDNEKLPDKISILSRSFAERLMGDTDSPIEWLRDMMLLSPAPHLSLDNYPYLKNLDLLSSYLSNVIKQRKHGANVFIYGEPGTGKTQLARLLVANLNCPLYEVTSEDEDGDSIDGEQRLCTVRAAQVFLKNTSSFLLFDEVEDIFNDYGNRKFSAQSRKAWMNRLLEENPVPTFWLCNNISSIDPAFMRRFDWVIELPVPPKSQREKIIRESCSHFLTNIEIQRLSGCEKLAPAIVTRATKVMNTLTDEFSIERLSDGLHYLMNSTLVAQGHSGIHSENVNHLPDVYDPELINCDADLMHIANGIKQNGNARLCLFGIPGTGKSAYARWLAEYLDKPLHVKRGSDLLSKWVGGTEKNIERIFREAQEEKAVLLIDEVDSFLQDRNLSQHSWEVTAVNEMLTRMEVYDGVFIASTNRLDGLDSASLRRFDLKIKFDALKPKQAWKLLQRYALALGLPEPNAIHEIALQKLDSLTPGDFAVLNRQNRFRPIKDIEALLEALKAECMVKNPHQRQSIGFI